MASYKSPIGVSDIKDKKTREALSIALENCQHFKEEIDKLRRELDIIKRKVV